MIGHYAPTALSLPKLEDAFQPGVLIAGLSLDLDERGVFSRHQGMRPPAGQPERLPCNISGHDIIQTL